MAGHEERVRAVGRRLPFPAVPAPVRPWLTGVVGEVAVVREHRGGMSPGCATSLRAADGTLLFVKAVGASQVTSLGPADRDAAVDFLVAFGGSQAWNARQPERPGLPHFAASAPTTLPASSPPPRPCPAGSVAGRSVGGVQRREGPSCTS